MVDVASVAMPMLLAYGKRLVKIPLARLHNELGLCSISKGIRMTQ